jgi:Family of unknown function (DUF5522)
MSAKELSYLSTEGFTIFTSQFFKNRGTCCKSACLHCPFGYTLKKLGLQFEEVAEAAFGEVEEIIKESGQESSDWKTFWPENIKFLKIKNQTCGVMLKNHLVVKKVFLKKHFEDQGLSKDIIESYYFI